MRQAASIADPHRDFGPAENVPLVGPLSECDQLIAGCDTAGLAKVTTLNAFRVEHRFLHDHLLQGWSTSHGLSRSCMNHFTQAPARASVRIARGPVMSGVPIGRARCAL